MSHLLTNTIYATLISFVINVILCPIIIPILHKLKFGQHVRSDGVSAHLKKTGTPTMGGIMIILSFVLASVFFIKSKESLFIVFMTVAYSFIGFADDYIKVVKKRSLGLRAYQKFLLQLIVTGIFFMFLVSSHKYSNILIPFGSGSSLYLGFLFIPFIFLVMIGTVNGANITDGLDGLASGVTVLITIFFVFCAISANNDVAPIGGALAGSLLGFLIFNSHPAKVFMGDTGSLALGGFIASTAIILRMPLFIVIVGIIYLIETLSVMLQVSYFKLTKGSRLFKMAPIHHHFELCGWSETKIVTLFYIVTAIMSLIGFLATNGIFSTGG